MTSSEEPPGVVVVSGNPRPGSRTLAAADAVADRVVARLGLDGPRVTVDLSSFADEILTATHPRADAALATLASARLAVVATPVYKASYTGLLKAFLDLYGSGGLAGVVAVPLVVSGNPGHSLAGEAHAASAARRARRDRPARALALVEAQLADVEPPVVAPPGRRRAPLRRSLGVPDAPCRRWPRRARPRAPCPRPRRAPGPGVAARVPPGVPPPPGRGRRRGFGSDGDRPVGFTATSVISVSAEPPVLAFSVADTSSSWPGSPGPTAWRSASSPPTRPTSRPLRHERRRPLRRLTPWTPLPTGEPVVDDAMPGSAGACWSAGRSGPATSSRSPCSRPGCAAGPARATRCSTGTGRTTGSVRGRTAEPARPAPLRPPPARRTVRARRTRAAARPASGAASR